MTRISLTALLLIAGLARAQEQGGTIQSESRLVLVDAVVSDHKGAHIRDLTHKDFKVFEDNREQTIATFSLESGRADSDRKQFMVFYFDDASSGAAQTFARSAAVRFIDSEVSPTHLMAIADYANALKLTQNFTDDKELLKRAIATTRAGSGTAGNPAGAMGATMNNYSVRSAMGALNSLIQNLGPLPGRKTLVLVSGGFPATQESVDQMRAVVETANRANVGIYPITASLGDMAMDSGSVVDAQYTQSTAAAGRRGGGRGAAPQQDTSPAGAQQTLFSLAAGTGGFVIANTNDLLSGLAKVGKEQEDYYILGYVPQKAAQPGACHLLKVKVDRGSIRARSGYCEGKSLDVLSGTSAERDLEARMNANASPTVTGASLQTPFFYTAANTARVHVELELPPGTLQFAREKGKYQSVLNIVGVAWLPDGAVRARFSDRIPFTFDDKKQAEAFAARPYSYEKQLPIGQGKYSFKVVFSSSSSQFGRIEAPLNIEPWEPSAFFLSGLALSHSAHPAKEGIPGIDAELVEDRVALVTGGVEIVPSATNRLSKSKKSYLFAEVYEPVLKDPPPVGVHMEMLDAEGKVKKDFGVMRLRLPEPTGKPAIPVGLIVTAPELPAGPYQLRVTAMDATGKEASRTIAIELEN